MTDRTPHVAQPRRRGWLIGAAVAAVAVLAVAIIWPQVTSHRAETPMATSTPTTVDSTDPVEGTNDPSDGSSPTIPVIPVNTPKISDSNPPVTPREQPTENEDSAPRETKAPVEITAEATPTKGIEARLVRIESVTGEVVIPGEVGGPALRITLEVTNNTSDDFDTPAVVVNLYTGPGLLPAGSLLNPGGKAFPEKIEPNDSAQGVYLFTVGPGDRDDITVEVDLAVGTPIVLFHGPVA